MKYLLSLLIITNFLLANEKSNKITNDTNADMLCVGTYPSVYKNQEKEGKKRRVKVLKNEEIIETIKVNQTLKKKREGRLVCYNEYAKIISMKDNRISKTNEHTLDSYLIYHNKYNLKLYENKNRSFVEKNFGIAQRCAPYSGGEYCNHGFGFDIYYNKNNRIKSIFLYESSVKRGKLPFKKESIFKLQANSIPLGPWVVKDYKKLFSKEPKISTNSLIIWENLSKYIKKVTMIPKNGYFELSRKMKNGHNLYKDGYEDSEKPIDYVGSIQVEYK